MNLLKFTLSAILIICFNSQLVFSQTNEPATENIFFFGNMWALETDDSVWEKLKTQISTTEGKRTVIFTGDFLDKNGLEKTPTEKELAKIEKLLDLGKSGDKMYFLAGEREWNNTKIGGLEKVTHLDDLLKAKAGNDVLISDDGCPGPKSTDINDNLVMMSINSHWLVHPKSDKPDEEDVTCGQFNETAFWSEVEDVLKDSEGKNVIIAAHHPIYSYGQYAGYKLTKEHFLPPVIGSFVASYHQNVGDYKDLSRPGFRLYSQRILKLMTRYPSVVFISGHEYDLQGHLVETGYHLNSGSIGKTRPVSKSKKTFYSESKRGFMQLKYQPTGAVDLTIFNIDDNGNIIADLDKKLYQSACGEKVKGIPVNEEFRPCATTVQSNQPITKIPAKTSLAAGKEYGRKKSGKFIWGDNHRDSWAATITEVPYLPLDTLYGGLTPVSKGGGGQTYNLKFKSADGRKFSFRSVDKDPTKRKDKELTSGVYGNIVQDMISTQHPYGALVARDLMNAADIPNSQSVLYVMPDSPILGIYQKEFAGIMGYLEIKPQGKKKSSVPFQNADRVESTLDMIQDLIEDNDHKVNAKSYAKERLMDMLMGDWDRHHDNWKWLGYNDGKGGRTYEAFPKDRDKAFGVLNGIYSPMDWEFVGKTLAQFQKSMKGLKSLNNSPRNLDRLFLTSLSEEDWVTIVQDFQKMINDEVIAKSILALPKEDQKISGPMFEKVLKIRRDKMDDVARKYYKMLAKKVDLFGSRKRELFEISRSDNGNVRVQMFKYGKGKKGESLFDRTFLKKETKEIRIYGLGNDDIFNVTGDVKKSILVRIIPGKGADAIADESKVNGLAHKTKIYTNDNQDQINLGSEGDDVTSQLPVYFRSEQLFGYDYHLILPSFSYNADDGFGVGVTANYTRQGFNKPGYGSKYSFSFNGTTEKSYNFGISSQYRHVIKKWDLQMSVSATNRDRSFRNFYGFGNQIEIDDELEDEGYYENIMETVTARVGFIRQFPHEDNKSSISVHGIFERRNLNPNPEEDGESTIYEPLESGQGRGSLSLPGLQTVLNLDFRDSGNFPTKGTQFKLSNHSFLNSAQDYDFGGRVESEASIFMTAHQMKTPLTLSVKVGGIHAYGEVPFYYQSFIGQQQNNRGYLRNRFGGQTAAFVNSELRLHLGTIYTPIVPLYVGVYGLYDTGRVWVDSDKDLNAGGWHAAYGGGFYMIPYAESFNLNFSVVRSEEEDLLFTFSVGFFVR